MRVFCRFMDQLAGVNVQQSRIGMFKANVCVNAKKTAVNTRVNTTSDVIRSLLTLR